MVDTSILLSRAAKALEGCRELGLFADRLPGDLKAPFLDALQGIMRDLEEIRPAGEALERMASFPELDPQPVAQIDLRTGRIDYLNAAGEAMFPDLRQAGLAHAWFAGLGQAGGTGLPPSAEYFRRELPLGEKWYEQDIVVARDGSGLRLYGRDITARKRIEAALKRAQEETEARIGERTEELSRTLEALEEERQRFNDVLNMLPAYVALLTPDHRVPFVNRFFRERFGDPGGRRCYEFLFRRTEACPSCETFRVLKTMAPHRWGWTGPDGRSYDVSDFPFTDRDGSRLVLEMGIDVTDRRIAEEERLRLATAVEQIADGVAILDPAGRLLSANPAFGAHLDRRPGELVGRDLRDVLELGGEAPKTGSPLPESLGSGEPWRRRLKRDSGDGRVRELDLTVSPIRDGSGRLINAIAVERDVTREARLEEQVRQWQKMEALGTLAGGIAHDFNNILLPIQINSELMLAGERADSQAVRRLRQVLEAAARGRDMVKQITTFARREEQERKPVEVPALLRESIELLRVSIPRSIEIVERIDPAPVMILADSTQVQQVLMNLASNAAHAMRDRGGVLEIGLEDSELDERAAADFIDLKAGPYLRLTVKDTGHGMSPEVRARIFEPFFTTKKQGEGTGMGLAVAHGIVKAHGGAITVMSEPGRGSTFTVYLPKLTGARPAEALRKEDLPTGSERVLFVDDEDLQVRAMTKLLEHLGYKVTAMSDPRTALDVFRRKPKAFDLVIADQTMPHISGIELAGEMLRLRPGLPVILCSGYSETVNEDGALAAGVKAFLPKPFSVKEIATAIRRALPSAGPPARARKPRPGPIPRIKTGHPAE